MRNKHYTRLQGAEWHGMKDKLKLVGYKANKDEDRSYIKGFYKDDKGNVFTHWMNDREIEEFKKEHTPQVHRNTYQLHRNTYEAQQLLYDLVLGENHEVIESIEELKCYINDKIKRSFDVDFGKSNALSDRLFTETIVELQLILEKLDEILEKVSNNV